MFKLGELQAHAYAHLYILVAAASVISLLFVFVIQIYNYFTKGYCTSTKRMDGKTVIITGANSGKFIQKSSH